MPYIKEIKHSSTMAVLNYFVIDIAPSMLIDGELSVVLDDGRVFKAVISRTDWDNTMKEITLLDKALQGVIGYAYDGDEHYYLTRYDEVTYNILKTLELDISQHSLTPLVSSGYSAYLYDIWGIKDARKLVVRGIENGVVIPHDRFISDRVKNTNYFNLIWVLFNKLCRGKTEYARVLAYDAYVDKSIPIKEAVKVSKDGSRIRIWGYEHDTELCCYIDSTLIGGMNGVKSQLMQYYLSTGKNGVLYGYD